MLTRSVRSIEWYMRASGLRRRSSRDLDGLLPDSCAEQDDFTTLVVGCSTVDTMEFHSECTSADVVSGIVIMHKNVYEFAEKLGLGCINSQGHNLKGT